jgi:hypothetical protein
LLAAAAAGQELPAALPELGAAASAPAPEVELAAPPAAPREAIEAAWFTPSSSLGERVWRTRRSALEQGVWNLDGAARALLVSAGNPLERAEAAVQLAPDLPAAQMELARAQWLYGESALGAVRTVGQALAAFTRHPEAGLWLAGSALVVLALGLVAGAALAICAASLLALPHAAHDFGDLVSRRLPAFARAALFAALLLALPLAGEGALGLVLGLLAVGVVYGRRPRRQRFALVLAAAALLAGAYPVARLAGAVLEALPADLVAQAALATSRGSALRADVLRLEAAAAQDAVAQEGLARIARREGRMGQADALYQALLERRPHDVVILNNAANVRLHLGHMESAFDLYRRALGEEESAVVLYNLAQAHGRAFQVDDLTETLELAQALDGELVADLTRLQGTQPEGFALDLPIPALAVWRRVLDPRRGQDFADALRAPLAPGRLGASPAHLAAGIALAVGAAALLGNRLRPSRWCARCGRRVCPRCHSGVSGGELCSACHKLFFQPEHSDRELRLARIEALRAREVRMERLALAASLALPGAAGLLAKRPVLALWGALCFALAACSLAWRNFAVPDPLVAGAAGDAAFACLAGFFGLGYALAVGAALAARRRSA